MFRYIKVDTKINIAQTFSSHSLAYNKNSISGTLLYGVFLISISFTTIYYPLVNQNKVIKTSQRKEREYMKRIQKERETRIASRHLPLPFST